MDKRLKTGESVAQLRLVGDAQIDLILGALPGEPTGGVIRLIVDDLITANIARKGVADYLLAGHRAPSSTSKLLSTQRLRDFAACKVSYNVARTEYPGKRSPGTLSTERAYRARGALSRYVRALHDLADAVGGVYDEYAIERGRVIGENLAARVQPAFDACAIGWQ